MTRPPTFLLVVALSLGIAGESHGSFITVYGDEGDGTVDVNGLPQDFTLTFLRAGNGGNNVRGLAPIFFFALPTLPSLDSLTSAELNLVYLGIHIGSPGNWAPPEFNVDLFGLGTRSTPTILSSDFFDGGSSLSTDALLAKGFVTPTTPTGALQLSGDQFTDYLRSLYNADGTPKAAYAVFRANTDVHLGVFSGLYRGYEFASADNTDNGGASVPRLELTTVPEPSSLTLALIGAIALTGFARPASGRIPAWSSKPLPGVGR
jgi:hypothetical protein